MNYFGLFFSFMVPGILIGWMCAYCFKEFADKKHRRAVKRVEAGKRQKLFVYNLMDDDTGAAA
ncbi:MAG: hypothetical protein BWY11_01516 [Firmicutes bacterium ADurb.Bin182]|nr:MAG: hypothetical protein BWY11_01516 [Firmicutes bacterium ADurb.Bin182]